MITSAVYIQMQFRNIFTMEANTISPDQNAPKGAVPSGSIVFAISIVHVHVYLLKYIN